MSLSLEAERADIEQWEVEFAPWVRAEIIARDKPPGWGVPRCFICGRGIEGRVDLHHVLSARRRGRGRPSNGICLHRECHDRIHASPAAARDNGWLRSQHAPKPDVYASPVLRWPEPDGTGGEWVVLLDEPDERGRWWRPENGDCDA